MSVLGDGRAFRFVGLVAGGWLMMRIAMLWHATGSLPAAVGQLLPLPRHAAARTPAGPEAPPPSTRLPPPRTATEAPHPMRPVATTPLPTLPQVPHTIAASVSPVPQAPAAVDPLPVLPPGIPPGPGRPPAPVSVSAWLIARSGVGGDLPLAPQLGGTQGGVRVDYAIGGGFAATGRIAVPVSGAGRELSLGIAWRPRGVPIRIVAERRIALDSARGGPSIGISGGIDAVPLPAGLILSGYAQAGTILRDRLDHFADGSARATRRVAGARGVEFDIGAGAWGGAQRGAARLDIGPSVGVSLPVAGGRMRATLDWRQRVAGTARPGSGPALTVGIDM